MSCENLLPIATAPKDGRIICGYTPASADGKSYVCRVTKWSTAAGGWVDGEGRALAEWDQPVYWDGESRDAP